MSSHPAGRPGFGKTIREGILMKRITSLDQSTVLVDFGFDSSILSQYKTEEYEAVFAKIEVIAYGTILE